MAITTFDTHKFVRRLEQAGVPLEQAEVQAEVLTEAFNVNLESLVTKDYLESRLDARFSEQKAYIDSRFSAQETRFNDSLGKLRKELSGDISNLEIKMEKGFARLDAKFDANTKLFFWIQAFVVTAVVIPLIQSLLTLF